MMNMRVGRSLAFTTLILLLLVETPSISAQMFRRDPCTNPSAYCRTEFDGSRWCGFEGETIQRCSGAKSSRRPPPARMDPMREESHAERIRRLREECRQRATREHAREGPGEFGATIFATKMAACNAIQ